MNTPEMFPRGSRVRTTHPAYLRKGQTERFGRIAGFCADPLGVRVTWDGWQPQSSVAVGVDFLESLREEEDTHG